MSHRRGFTLIELLVVIAIIARPDRPAAARRAGGPRGRAGGPVRQQPQAARPGDRTTTRRRSARCRRRCCMTGTPGVVTWTNGFGAHPSILPFAEQGPLFNCDQFRRRHVCDRGPEPDGHRRLPRTSSSARARSSQSFSPHRRRPDDIANYGFGEGDWFVWGGLGSDRPNRSAFGPNQSRRLAEFTRRPEQHAADVRGKAFMPYYRDCPQGPSRTSDPARPPLGERPAARRRPLRGGARIPGRLRAPRRRDGRAARRVVRVGRASHRLHDRLAAEQEIRGGPEHEYRRRGPQQQTARRSAGRRSRRSRRAATTPAASTPCSATARSGSSRARSTAPPGARLGSVAGGEVVSSDAY